VSICEAWAFLDKAREFLAKVGDMFADGWPDEAGRAAYLAGLHAAQAVIVERTGRVIKRASRPIRAEIGQPIHLRKPVGHVAQKNRHIVVRILVCIPACPRAD
jgi:hypothetical protein